MNARILNRENTPPEDGWFHIEVTGTHPAGKGRKQLIDTKALGSIVNRFHAEREAEGEGWMGMLVDIDHFSRDLSKSTEAWAWLQDLEIRNNELYGKLDLTDLGDAAIRNKRVKRFSTEYDPADTEEVEPGVVRPLRLAGLAFTNRPNNRGGTPISNRAETDAEPETKNENMKSIAEKLGLPADADETAILAKITELMSANEASMAKEAESEAVAIMNRYEGRIPEDKKEEVKSRLLKNREDTVAMLDLLPEKKAEAKTPPARIHNREGSESPEPVEATEPDDGEMEAKRTALVEKIRRAEGCSHDKAWNLARRESPELFA